MRASISVGEVEALKPHRRTPASARRRAQAEALAEHVRDTDPARAKPVIDSKTTRATPCPSDPAETEETLP